MYTFLATSNPENLIRAKTAATMLGLHIDSQPHFWVPMSTNQSCTF